MPGKFHTPSACDMSSSALCYPTTRPLGPPHPASRQRRRRWLLLPGVSLSFSGSAGSLLLLLGCAFAAAELAHGGGGGGGGTRLQRRLAAAHQLYESARFAEAAHRFAKARNAAQPSQETPA